MAQQVKHWHGFDPPTPNRELLHATDATKKKKKKITLLILFYFCLIREYILYFSTSDICFY